jgi:DNA-binding winged helix-turn-helix (wHTH) protein
MILRVSGSFRFGDFELDVAAFTLRREGIPVPLEKIPMEVLVLLVEHAGTLVARDSIHAALWGSDVFLDRDAAINTAMRKIRKALGEEHEPPDLDGRQKVLIPVVAEKFAPWDATVRSAGR